MNAMSAAGSGLNFAITGVGGFVAPRHLQAIKDVGGTIVAALDPHDAVGILDRYSLDIPFFTEFERFDRHIEKLRRGPEAGRVHYLSVCAPNYLHDSHIRMALRVGAHVICEKPIVINPWNLDALASLEREAGRKVHTVLQLRLQPSLRELRDRIAAEPAGSPRHDVVLSYVTARGRWYDVSWKGSMERSGGVGTNIGVHLFDLMLWLFGGLQRLEVHLNDRRRMSGLLECPRAHVRWYLSTDPADLKRFPAAPGKSTFRSITIDGQETEFSDGFTDLHTRTYEAILAGRGFGIDDARPSIELCHMVRTAGLSPAHPSAAHPALAER